jgi:hypothetical protein
MFVPAMYAYPATQMPAAYLPQFYGQGSPQGPYSGGAVSSSALPSVYDMSGGGSPHYASPLSDSGGNTNPPPFNPEYAAAHEHRRLSMGQ